jgi:HlyD family secretion protein
MTATAEIVVHEVHDALLAPNVALRFSPPAQAEEQPASGGLMSNLLPHMPRTQASRQDSQAGAGVHQVWTLRDGKAVSFPVRTGVTDGTMTQIESGDVQAGTPLIVESKASGS